MSFPIPAWQRHRDIDYEIGTLLGRGTYTSVYEATHKPTGKLVAVKVVDRYRCEKLKKTADLYMEKHCLSRTNHVNIVKMQGWFSDNTSIFVVMEACLGGELWDIIKTVGCPRNYAIHYFTQVINACQYLRDARIVHRDLKAENIMLTEMGVVKVIDFGTAKDLENPQIKGSGNASRHKVFEDYVGTPQFMPLEVIENKRSDFRSDTWSLGCTFFQVLTGCPPFHAASEYLVFCRIQEHDLKFPPGVHPKAEDLIKRMVVQDADERLGGSDLEQVRQHEFFEGAVFKDAHKRPPPVPSLADMCLYNIGKRMGELHTELDSWDGMSKLTDHVRDQVERMKMTWKWQDDVLPPEEHR
eukprot:TRINITY_DN15736_c0_g1_i1.p1 TRINITY_DN15736_c0_g1~~TRINITY_DN15736_c0_g1_i1.p1  ORF type:complete len:355 (-),score=74.50 TRINITY_DN15736_c0_g1_i1:67-1131(-)